MARYVQLAGRALVRRMLYGAAHEACSVRGLRDMGIPPATLYAHEDIRKRALESTRSFEEEFPDEGRRLRFVVEAGTSIHLTSIEAAAISGERPLLFTLSQAAVALAHRWVQNVVQKNGTRAAMDQGIPEATIYNHLHRAASEPGEKQHLTLEIAHARVRAALSVGGFPAYCIDDPEPFDQRFE